jgi:hypothetical protein
LSPTPLTPVHAKQARRNQMIRDGLIILVSLVLSVTFLVFGPAGDFIAGRVFTVSLDSLSYDWSLRVLIWRIWRLLMLTLRHR